MLMHCLDDTAQVDRGMRVLHIALAMPSEATVAATLLDLLLNAGADVNAKDKKGMTPLFLAVAQDKFDAALKLLQFKANASLQMDDGSTALFAAAMKGNRKMMELLLEAGASENDVDRHGGTVLHVAVANQQIDAVRLLLERGADPNVAERKNKFTAVHGAASSGNVRLLKLLVKHGGRVDAKAAKGKTLNCRRRMSIHASTHASAHTSINRQDLP